MRRLDNPVQHYAWGSRTAIPRLLGAAPTGEPWAELWMGAHPRAPSRVDGRALGEIVREDPVRVLGGEVAARFGGELPFLLKVLAAEEPLSLQAHPSEAQARAGFAAEEAAGVPIDAVHRNYKDAHHKPELVVALEPFEALCGFRPVADTLALFGQLGVDEVCVALAGGLCDAFATILRTLDPPRIATIVDAARRVDDGPFVDACRWAVRLHDAYPGDPGVVASLLLEHVVLAPGEGLFLPAGNLHAYLHGTAIEIMASSDNVLRGGLTPKHVDVDELLRVLDFTPHAIEPLRPEARGVEAVYRTPAPEFTLSRLDLHAPFEVDARGPEIVLVLDGRCTVDDHDGTLALDRGASAFASPGRYRLVPDAHAVVFRATVGITVPSA